MRYYMTFRPFSQGAGFAVIFVAFVPHKEFCFLRCVGFCPARRFAFTRPPETLRWKNLSQNLHAPRRKDPSK